MKDIFITSTLKAEWNKKFNLLLCKELEGKGINCHLPQRDTKQNGSELEKYNQNIEGIKNSKMILTIGMNESVNWGLETGFAFGLGKKVILLTNKDNFIPTMSLGMYYKILKVDNLDNFEDYIDDLVETFIR